MSIEWKFNRIGIYGVGLMGGSLGLALKQAHPECCIVGIGRNESRLHEAKRLGAIDESNTFTSPIEAPLDLLILCTPVRLLSEHLQKSLPYLSDHAVITDVGSTKSRVIEFCEPLIQKEQVFIGSHPMAGSHKTGVQAADSGLFQNRVCVVTPTDNTPKQQLNQLISLWQSVGMRVVQLTPQVHDELTAFSSHTPHLIAAALCLMAREKSPQIFDVLGKGFSDTTRIAAGDPNVWLDICLENREHILDALDTLSSQIESIQQAIQHSNEDEILNFLKQAQVFRESI